MQIAASGKTIRRSAVIGGLTLWLVAGGAMANSGGRSGNSQTGCQSCHNDNAFPGYGARINGSAGGSTTVAPSSSTTFTTSGATGGTPAPKAGFNLSTNIGNLAAGGDNNLIVDAPNADELTHDSPGKLTSGGNVSWSFTFNAPASVGTGSAFVCVNPVENTAPLDSANDGPSVCTTHSITVNRMPTANPDAFSVAEDSGQSGNLNLRVDDFSGTGSNDADGSIDGVEDIDIDRINGSAAATVATINGSVARNGNTVQYTPDANFSGSDNFTYRIVDTLGATATATVTMTVTAVNDAPTASGDSVAAVEDTATTFNSLESNDTDIDGDTLFIDQVTNPSAQGGSVAISGGNVAYQAAANFCGNDSFTYRVRDRATAGTGLTSGFATVNVSVSCMPDAPVANADTPSVARGSDNNLLLVLANDSDPDNLAGPANAGLSVSAAVIEPGQTALAGEAVSVTGGGGSVTYTPPSDFSGTRLVRYTITDGALTANVLATVTVAAGTAPVAVADGPFTVDEDSLASNLANAFNVLANDSDVDGDTLSISVTQMPANGVLSGDGGVLLTYQPDDDFAGADSFRYRARDSATLLSNEITVNITITAQDDAPVAVADSLPVPPLVFREDQGPFLLDVLANDTDVDAGDTRSVSAVTQGSQAAVVAVSGAGPNNQVSYNPALNFNGTETFTYTVRDSDALTDSDSVTVTVFPVNDAPLVTSTAITSANDAQLYQYQVAQSDVDDNAFTYSLSGAPTTGTPMSISASGLITWTPPTSTSLAPYTVGPITVTVTDSGGSETPTRLLSATQTFSITVNAPDTDGDGIPNSYESANGFDPNNPADGAADRDGDGRSNRDEFQQGRNPDVDDVAPALNLPATVQVNATGFLTAVDLGVATANDVKDGARAVIGPTPRGPFRPGRYSITYSASDSSGNTASNTQRLDVLPRVELGADRISGEGATISVPVILSGNAPAYPVQISYSIGGSAVSADHDAVSGSVTMASGTQGNINIAIVGGDGPESDETIVLTLTGASGAALGTRLSQTTTVVDRNVAPQVILDVRQWGGPQRTQIFANQGPVTVTALALDPNPGDVLSFDFAGTAATLPAPSAGAASSFMFDPAGLGAGRYLLRVTVRDAAGAASTAETSILLLASASALTAADSDGDGIADATESFADADGDGVLDYLDQFAEPFTLPAGGSRVMESESGLGLRIGPTAIAAGRAGALIAAADVIALGEGAGPVSNAADPLENNGGLFDLEIYGLAPGGSASVVVPLQSALRPGAVWRKYRVVGGWRAFVSDANNFIASSPSLGGQCPAPGSSSYTPGLTALNTCVRLRLQDGGPNDADGLVNGRVRDPGGAAVAPATAPADPPTGKSGGGGALGLYLLVGLWTFAGFALYRRRRVAT